MSPPLLRLYLRIGLARTRHINKSSINIDLPLFSLSLSLQPTPTFSSHHLSSTATFCSRVIQAVDSSCYWLSFYFIPSCIGFVVTGPSFKLVDFALVFPSIPLFDLALRTQHSRFFRFASTRHLPFQISSLANTTSHPSMPPTLINLSLLVASLISHSSLLSCINMPLQCHRASSSICVLINMDPHEYHRSSSCLSTITMSFHRRCSLPKSLFIDLSLHYRISSLMFIIFLSSLPHIFTNVHHLPSSPPHIFTTYS